MAAFTLGRIAYDRRDYREAARWFATYLREEPSGSVAREAAGRLIETEKAAETSYERATRKRLPRRNTPPVRTPALRARS